MDRPVRAPAKAGTNAPGGAGARTGMPRFLAAGPAAGQVFRAPDAPSSSAHAGFDSAKWFGRFKASVQKALDHLGLGGKHVVLVRAVEDFTDEDDLVHPAHYNPNDRTIYFSYSGFRALYNDRIVEKHLWSEADFDRTLVEAALEEAFHASQDAPRFKSDAYTKFDAEVGPKLMRRFAELIEMGVMDTYEKFEMYIPVFTSDYLPEEKIEKLIGEIGPGESRAKGWRLSAREEVMTQWLKILEDRYFRARFIVAAFRKPGKKELPAEQKHRVSLIEKQAALYSKLKADDVKLALLLDEAKAEKDPGRLAEITKKIAALRARLDWKTRIPQLEAEKKKLETEAKVLDPLKPDEHARLTAVFKQLSEITDVLDSLYAARDGVEAVLRRKKLLLPR